MLVLCGTEKHQTMTAENYSGQKSGSFLLRGIIQRYSGSLGFLCQLDLNIFLLEVDEGILKLRGGTIALEFHSLLKCKLRYLS